MKMKDLLPEKEQQKMDGCELCETHKRAYTQIPDGVICPYCGHNHPDWFNDFMSMANYQVVGMMNGYNPEDNISKFLVFNCEKCGEYIAMMPEKVIYNGNHDVYYTGGSHYLNDDNKNEIFMNAQSKIEAHLKQWIERYESGDKVSISNVALWLKRDITHAIAEYLFEKGLKK